MVATLGLINLLGTGPAALTHDPIFDWDAAVQSLDIYWPIILLTLPFTLVLSLAGTWTVIRRESLYGILTGQASYIFFMFCLSLFHWLGWDLFDLINRRLAQEGGAFLWLVDAAVLPVSLVLLAVFLQILRRFSRNTEASLAVLLVLLFALENLFTQHEKALVNLYFTDLVYTPQDVFWTFLPFLAILAVGFLIHYRVFLVLSVDKTQARLQNLGRYEALYNIMMPLLIVIGVRVLGPYIAVTALIAPALAATAGSWSMPSFWGLTLLMSVAATILSFMAAFAFGTSASAPVMVLTWLITALLVAVFGSIRARK